MKVFRRHPPVRRALDPHSGKPIPKPNLIQRAMIAFASRKLRPFLASRKTTLGGVSVILGALLTVAHHLVAVADGAPLSFEVFSMAGTAILGGIAAICAKDADKTGVPKS